METVLLKKSRVALYVSLMKPGIVAGNMVTAIGAFILASKGSIDFLLLLAMFGGLSLIIASGCAANNYIDRFADQKMKRTQDRPLAKGAISKESALIFAVILGLLGIFFLSFFVNLLAVAIALAGFAVYVFFYSFAKYRSPSSTLIGSIAGAVPPVVGYCSASSSLDGCALLLFLIMVLWQMPHFYAIALYRMDEYAAASIPVLPLKKGVQVTKIHMIVYTAAFCLASRILAMAGYAGRTYAIIAAILGFFWLLLAIGGLFTKEDRLWARRMFFFSLVVVTVLFSTISLK
jgi:heme o synthase